MPDFLVFELNIEYGLYIGGRGTLDVHYLNSTPINFRGCINDVIFNNHDILTSLKSSARNKNIHEVSLSCSNEFFAREEEPLSFFSSKSYVSFPIWNVQAGGILEYSVQTTAQRGLLIYSSGPLEDFVAMEIENGLIKAHIRMGKNRLELSSLSSVNDNQWHVIRLKFSIKYVELTLEKKTVKTPLPSHSRLPILKGALYVGGINDAFRTEVLKQGLASVSGRYGEGGSFRGCLKDLVIGSQKYSLKNVQVTKDISVGCTTPNFAPEKQAMRTASPISVVGTVAPKLLRKEIHDHFLSVNDLIVSEGGQTFLGSKHIKVSVDFKALGIRQSQILFRIKYPPSYGQLRLNVVSKQEDFTFSMLDLWQGKVLYIHDGSEENYDYFTFFVFTSSKRKMPLYLEGNDEYMFTITVRPVNDAPELIFPNGNLLLLLEHSKKCLSIDLVNIVDNDTSAADLSITVLGNSNADAGFLENSKTPGKTITTFSYEDLQHGNVFFVHTGVQNSRIVLRASDGEKVSNTVVLRVMAVPLDYKLVNNTGVDVVQGTPVLITRSHLATEINAFQQELEIRYEMTEEPFFGKIQRRHTSREWKKANSFSQRSIERGRVSSFTNQDIYRERLMYIHDDSETQCDEIHITATAIKFGEEDLEAEFPLSLQIKFNISIHLKNDEKPVRVVDKVFHVVQNGRKLLTLDDLCYHDPDTDFDDNQLLYTRRGIPNGDLVLVNETSYRLYQFKQEDLIQKQVLFVHRGATYGRFVLFVTDGKHYTSSLLEVSASEPYVLLANNTGLLIQKGKEAVITTTNLSATTNQDIRSDHEIRFEIFFSPKYGQIFVNNLAVATFTQHDLKMELVTYRHDDSNNLIDTLNFTVYAKGLHLDAEMKIQIYLESHQRPPVILHNHSILVEEGKLVQISNGNLLAVHENSLPSEIEFKVRSSPVYGYLWKFISNENYLGAEENPILSFTQQDINDGIIQYIQTISNQLQDHFSLDVTNGIQTVSGIEVTVDILPKLIPLEIHNFTVAEGGSKVLEEDILKISNSHFAEVNCDFSLVEPPKHGRIANSHFFGMALTKFTRKQVENGLVFYVHDDSEQLLDNFTMVANCTQLWKQSLPQIIFVTIIPVNDEAPIIKRNIPLRVWVGSVTEITTNELLAEDKDSSPAELLYSVSPPNNGHLALKSSPNKNILNFTQAHIEEGQVVFVHTGSRKSITSHNLKAVTNDVVEVDKGLIIYEHSDKQSVDWSTQDYFTFTVSSPPASLGQQVFHINISYEIRAHNQSSQLLANTGAVVQEGGRVLIDKTKLDGSNLLSKLPQTQRSSFEVWYEVIALPQHGRIVVGERNITRDKPHFSQYIINKFGITYVHDDSESLTDHFIFAVWLNEKNKSTVKPNIDVLEEAFNITVVPVNDQVPKLQSKLLCLNVLQGDRKVLGQDNLNVDDLDNSPEEIKYTIITDPQNGHLALWTRLNESIKNFTQADINDGSVWFVQDGSPFSGVFYFSVTDGQHRPQYKLFQLDVIPVSVTLINLTEVVLLQGQDRVAVTNVHLSAVTNGKNPEIRFEVTKPFRYGKLLIENEQVTTFHQRDLYAARLLYCMADFTAFGDTLEFAVFSSDSNLTGQVLKILVQPLLQMALNVTVPNRMSYQLNPSYLDATQLATLTKSNPQFEVIMSPVHGSLSRRSLSNAESKSLVLFTKRDIDMGVIYLETNANMTNTDVLNDSFSFILTADHVQPAIGEFHFIIVQQDPSPVQVFTPEVPFLTTADILETYITENEHVFIPKHGAHTDVPAQTFMPDQNHWEHQKDTQFDEDNTRGISVWAVTTIKTQSESTWLLTLSSRNWLIIIVPLSSVAALFIIIAIVLCIFLMCHRSKKAKPLILEQPPVILNSSSFSVERSLTIPTVTVTPLFKSMDKTSVLPFMSLQREQSHPMPATPDPAVSLLQSTWSSLDPEIIQHCRKTHPTLKCNQYWV
ncbi:Chondroitin sulfate proteoglycan 4, partial [Ophiophagus hannah]